MLSLKFNGSVDLDFRRFLFNGGEVQVRVDFSPVSRMSFGSDHCFTITADIRGSDDVMAVLLMNDAIREYAGPDVGIELVCPYFPYARQDRVCCEGEAFSARVMAGLLNGCGFRRVSVWDIHSDVSLKLINNVRNIPAAAFVRGSLRDGEYVVAPDKGAVERAMLCAGVNNPLIRMSKSRDPDTGYLSLFSIDTDIPRRDRGAIIVDDICDGGRTFIGAAKLLREQLDGPIRLFVTHGIFSNGFADLLKSFDEILVANSFVAPEDLPEGVRIVS